MLPSQVLPSGRVVFIASKLPYTSRRIPGGVSLVTTKTDIVCLLMGPMLGLSSMGEVDYRSRARAAVCSTAMIALYCGVSLILFLSWSIFVGATVLA